MRKIIIILGSPNDDKGNLLSIAKERLDKGLVEFKKLKDCKILLTGGFGAHFNRTYKPHSFYAKQFLLKKGILEKDILEFAESSNTTEDAALSKPIIDKHGVKDLIIVTSDFHIDRVKYIFEKVFKEYNLVFVSSKTILPDEEIKILKKHEISSLDKLKKDFLE